MSNFYLNSPGRTNSSGLLGNQSGRSTPLLVNSIRAANAKIVNHKTITNVQLMLLKDKNAKLALRGCQQVCWQHLFLPYLQQIIKLKAQVNIMLTWAGIT